VTPAALAAAYLLGSVATVILTPTLRLLGKAFHWLLEAIAIRRYEMLPYSQGGPMRRARRPRLFFSLMRALANATRPMSISARSLVIDSINSTLSKVGVPGGAAFIFPAETAIAGLHNCAGQLSQAASPQHQEYDRVRCEVELRLAVVPPILVLGIIAPLNGRELLISGSVLVSAVLLWQANQQTRAAAEILANATYFGYATIPLAQSVADYLTALEARPNRDGEWMGAIIVGLHFGGYFEEGDMALRDLLEFNEYDRSVAREYLGTHDPEQAELFDRLMEVRVPPPWERADDDAHEASQLEVQEPSTATPLTTGDQVRPS
jgi:hypothetical protein